MFLMAASWFLSPGGFLVAGHCVKGQCDCDCRPANSEGEPMCWDGEFCQWAPE